MSSTAGSTGGTAVQALLARGLQLGRDGDGEGAVATLLDVVRQDPRCAPAWQALAAHLHALGDLPAAAAAEARHIQCSTSDPRVMEAAAALVDNNLPVAERLLKQHLKERPTDVAAIRMLGELAARLGRYVDAENLLARAVELAPGFAAARFNLAAVRHRQNKPQAALPELDHLLALAPDHPGYRSLKAAVLAGLGENTAAIELYERVLREYPNQSRLWMSQGHALKTAGRRAECEAAYRRAIALEPKLGEVYWSLANLKTFRFTDAEVAAMQAQLAATGLRDEDRFHFEFSLGKAFEDRGDWTRSFEYYAAGNRRRGAQLDYQREETTGLVDRTRATFTREFLAARAGQGCPAPDPIFIVGLPRAGSTLIEQILSSHPLVEGTAELPELTMLARRLTAEGRQAAAAGTEPAPSYPGVLARLDAAALRALGEEYLERTRHYRKTDRPYFIDKLPNNFAHLGLLHLILPNARVIDARRHPLGGCFSAYKQHFARGQAFSYDLTDLGHYYRDYVRLMAHFDGVLPGRVHRVIYEQMVGDTEGEVRRLLGYCGLPFDAACLRFHENDRPVRTASSEQVRQPIYKDGVDQWRHFEPWLGPLVEALGPVLSDYPAVPAEFTPG